MATVAGIRALLRLSLVLLVSQQRAACAEFAGAWRLINADPIDLYWGVRTLTFFADLECKQHLVSAPNHTGIALASDAADMTGADYIFMAQTPRGWESTDKCEKRACHIGFAWNADQELPDVRCVSLYQGEEGTHAPKLTLQRLQGPLNGGDWIDVVTWNEVQPGRTRLALQCPGMPSVPRARAAPCQISNPRTQDCPLVCDDGYGTTEPRLRCINGVWYMPECLQVGSMIRLVAAKPESIKPHWVILHATLFENEDCSGLIRMHGSSISSGEFVIKYANYHPKNVWDGSGDTSWASKDPCTPGTCWLGFRFSQMPKVIRCVKIEHPADSKYWATEVNVQQLAAAGWEDMKDVFVQFVPEQRAEL